MTTAAAKISAAIATSISEDRTVEVRVRVEASGNLDWMEDAEKEYKQLLEKLYSSTKKGMNIGQVEFQKLVGKIEVLGELLIKG